MELSYTTYKNNYYKNFTIQKLIKFKNNYWKLTFFTERFDSADDDLLVSVLGILFI